MNTVSPGPLPAAPSSSGPLQAAPSAGGPLQPAPQPMYKKREKIFPRNVEGTFRRLKWIILFITLGIYYITPWLRWDRGPYAPDQAVLVDLDNRRFYFFAIEIWPQEFYYVAGMLIMAGIGLFLVTTSVGRAWCGYACPQTVWTDLFMAVERWIEGDRNARMKLDKAPWTAGKIAKRTAVHSSWLIIALLTGGAWVFYFADAPSLLSDIMLGTAPFTAYATIAILTFTTYSLAGLMREQVCTYMCPWPRIQSAMLDEDSFLVTYKAWRGEPRGSVKSATHSAAHTPAAALSLAEPPEPELKAGDCIDCMACVNVCPTGIDIRNGPQLECITCALCIDACNDVMAKLDRPLDLIGYTTLNRDQEEAAGKPLPPMWKTLLRPRVILYFLLWAGIGLGMLFVLVGRPRVELLASQERNPLYVQLSDGSIRNAYTVKILNKESRPRSFTIRAEGLEGAQIRESLSEGGTGDIVKVKVRPDGIDSVRIYVTAPAAVLTDEHVKFEFVTRPFDGSEEASASVRFSGPESPERENRE